MAHQSQVPADTAAMKPAFAEFVILLAFLMSMVALAIDAILPAMTAIGGTFGILQPSQLQWLVGALFAGMAVGQIFYGPFSDSKGRKPAIYTGLLIFLIGSLIAVLAQDYNQMLLGRFIQGLGVSGPKVVAVALVRDRYQGRAMARVMSFIMAVFVIMPALAPSIGAGIMLLTDWRGIYLLFVLLTLIVLAWFALRQPETLSAEKRLPLSWQRLKEGCGETVKHRATRVYIVAAGLIFGAFIAYLSTAQLIFREIFAIEAAFPLYFALLALSVGFASFMNGRLVMRYGMHLLARRAMQVMFTVAIIFLLYRLIWSGPVPIGLFMLAGALTFSCVGLLFGNMNALAMEPMGHIAGVASSVIGSLTTLISMLVGMMAAHLYNGTLIPLFAAFALFALLALLITRRELSQKTEDNRQ